MRLHLPLKRQADLTSERDMYRFRTTPPPPGKPTFKLYEYCGQCVHAKRSPIAGVTFCELGDRGDVTGYSDKISTGEIKEQGNGCPGFEVDQGDTSQKSDETIHEARRIVADTTAGFTKDVPGEAEVVPEEPEEPAPEDLTEFVVEDADNIETSNAADLTDLYNYLGVVGVNPNDRSAQGLSNVGRALSTWRGGELSSVLQSDPDLVRRVWEGYAKHNAPPPPAAAPGTDAAGNAAVEDTEIEIDPDHYIWRTRHDNRVRSEHRWRDGKVFEWDDPPPGGHPGEAPGCRCDAEAITELPGMRHAIRRCNWCRAQGREVPDWLDTMFS